MSKFFRSFFIAFSIAFILHLLSAIFISFYNLYDRNDWNDFLKNIPLTFSLFFVPIFFSLFFFDKSKSVLKNFLKPILFSIIFLSIVEIIHLGFIYKRPNFQFVDEVLYRVVFMGSFINFFVTILLLTNVKTNSKVDGILIFSWKKVFIYPLLGAILYSIIVFLSSGYRYNILLVLFRMLPSGLILTVITALFFKRSSFTSNRKKILLFYVCSILGFSLFLSISDYITVFNIGTYRIQITKTFIPTLVLSTPYYLFVIGTIHLYFKNLSNKQENQFLKQQSLENQINYQQLKNQLSPHFLFNNINVLSSFIEENPQKAVAYSNNLADVYHYFLEQEKQDVVKVVDEISFAEKYLQLLQDRFEEGLAYTINIDSEIKQKLIVATILQQVLENVIKHNIIDKTSLIHINISSKENYLIVSNNKNLKRNKQLTSNKGIENIKQRISFFTEKKVIIEDTNETYSIKLPILETI